MRYTANDLSEGAIDVFGEADGWREDEDGNIVLTEEYENEEGEIRKRRVGLIKAGRWESVMIEPGGTPGGD